MRHRTHLPARPVDTSRVRGLASLALVIALGCAPRAVGGVTPEADGGDVVALETPDDPSNTPDAPLFEEGAWPHDRFQPDDVTFGPDTTPSPPDASIEASVRCTRDSECSGSTFCDTASGRCLPIVCTPGRASCLSATRARVCNDRGSAFIEMDCPGGCSAGACASGMATCPGTQTRCGEGCVDTRNDTNHCGGCGNRCPSGQRCSAGACSSAAPCEPPLVACSGACVDTQTDQAHCGACGRTCLATQVCTAGTCTASTACAAPRTLCGILCTDLQSDPAHCGACGRTCTADQVCVMGTCFTASSVRTAFQIDALGSTGCRVQEHTAVTGDDRGGIAMGSNAVFYTGDTSTGRFDPETLAGTSVGVIHDGLVSNLRTGTVYVFGTGASTGVTASGGMLTHLIEVDGGTGRLTARAIALSTPIPVVPTAGAPWVGIFSGWDRAAVASGGFVYDIDLRTGGVAAPVARSFARVPFRSCESWAFWGVAEFIAGALHLTYVEIGNRVVRMNVLTGVVGLVATFSNLGDMCSFTVDPRRSRWYFHHEGVSQFGGSGETIGHCPATLSVEGMPVCTPPLRRCGTSCVDVTSDRMHCGACDNVCPIGQVCAEGMCVLPSGGNYTLTEPPPSETFTEIRLMPGVSRALMGADDASVLVPMPFAFTFWGVPLPADRRVNISSNGFVSFDGMSLSPVGGRIPQVDAPNGVVAAFWRDLMSSTTGVCHVTLGSPPSRRFVVEWVDARVLGGTGQVTMEVVLHEGTGVIDVFMASNTTGGLTATVGIEDLAGARAVSGCSPSSTQCALPSGSRLRFQPTP